MPLFLFAEYSCSSAVSFSCKVSHCQFIMCFKIKFAANPFKCLIDRPCNRPACNSHTICNFLMGLVKNIILVDQVTLLFRQNRHHCMHYKVLRKRKSLPPQVPFSQWSEQPFDGYHHIQLFCHTLHRSHDDLLYCSKLYHSHSVPFGCIVLLQQSLSRLHEKDVFVRKPQV